MSVRLLIHCILDVIRHYSRVTFGRYSLDVIRPIKFLEIFPSDPVRISDIFCHALFQHQIRTNTFTATKNFNPFPILGDQE